MSIKDKVCVVTGAGSGIGKSISEEFARQGARVVVSSRREVNGQPVSDNINKSGGDSVFIKCDVSEEKDVKTLFEKAVEHYGRIDVLINNAGVNFVKDFIELTVEDWDRVMNTDLRGTFLCSKYAVDQMLKNGGGSICNIATIHTHGCLPGAVPYDSAKWGVVGLTKSMAVELADKNIRVNAISPGLINTQIWTDLKNAAVNEQQCIDYWNSNIPMNRVGESIEIAKSAAFISGDDAAYITGANLYVDGGLTSLLISKANFESKSVDGGER